MDGVDKQEGLKQQCVFAPSKYKDCNLVHILTQVGGCSSMVFTRTCDATDLLTLMLRNLGFRAIPINGQMSQAKRLEALKKFKAGECNILICTDLAVRGIDLFVDLVINYDIPSYGTDYINRLGRTTRAGGTGVDISLVSQYQIELFMQIEYCLGKKLPQYPAEEIEVLLLQKRVREANRMAQMKLKMVGGGRKRGRGEETNKELVKGSKFKFISSKEES